MSAIVDYGKQLAHSSVGQSLVIGLIVFGVHTLLVERQSESLDKIAKVLPDGMHGLHDMLYEPKYTAMLAAGLWLIVATVVFQKPLLAFLPSSLRRATSKVASYIEPDMTGFANVGATVQAMQKTPDMRGSLSIGDTFD